jgi:hypothetical protein
MMMIDTASAITGIAFQRLGFSAGSTVVLGGASVTVLILISHSSLANATMLT